MGLTEQVSFISKSYLILLNDKYKFSDGYYVKFVCYTAVWFENIATLAGLIFVLRQQVICKLWGPIWSTLVKQTYWGPLRTQIIWKWRTVM